MRTILGHGSFHARFACDRLAISLFAALLVLPFLAVSTFAHAVATGDKGYIQEIAGDRKSVV